MDNQWRKKKVSSFTDPTLVSPCDSARDNLIYNTPTNPISPRVLRRWYLVPRVTSESTAIVHCHTLQNFLLFFTHQLRYFLFHSHSLEIHRFIKRFIIIIIIIIITFSYNFFSKLNFINFSDSKFEIDAEERVSGSISKMSHSIFHQTLLCQTSTVAEHQSKRGVIGNSTLFQSQQSVDKEKKLFLSTNFRGNPSFFVRKRKVAMGSKQTVPRAVLTSNAASQVFIIASFNL